MNETRSSVCQAACDGWWIVRMTATAARPATSLTFSRTPSAEAESRPLVGSSRSSVFGSATSSTAMDRRRFWPPLRPLSRIVPTMTSAQIVSPSSSRRASARCRRGAADEGCRGVERLLRREHADERVLLLDVRAALAARDVSLERPALARLPSMRPAKASSSVVLPLPDGPRTPQTCPPRTAPEQSSRIVFCPLALSGTLNVRPFQRTSQLDGCSTSTRLSDICSSMTIVVSATALR